LYQTKPIDKTVQWSFFLHPVVETIRHQPNLAKTDVPSSLEEKEDQGLVVPSNRVLPIHQRVFSLHLETGRDEERKANKRELVNKAEMKREKQTKES